MPTASKTNARSTAQKGATILAAVRTISGLPSHRDLEDVVLIYKCWVILWLFVLGFQMPSDIFWKTICILEAAKRRILVSITVWGGRA